MSTVRVDYCGTFGHAFVAIPRVVTCQTSHLLCAQLVLDISQFSLFMLPSVGHRGYADPRRRFFPLVMASSGQLAVHYRDVAGSVNPS